MLNIGVISYLISAGLFIVLSILLVTSWRGRLQGALLVVACLASAVWACVYAYGLAYQSVPLRITFLVEVLRNVAWLVFLLALGGGLAGQVVPKTLTYAVYGLSGALIVYSLGQGFLVGDIPDGRVLIYGGLFLALVGFVLIEQLYRNTSPERRNAVKFLYLGLGAMFAYDLYLYANAILLSEIGGDSWVVRGVVNTLIVPLIAISASRNSEEWSLKIFVSRHVIFYGAGLMGVGLYLLAMAAGGYYVKSQGGEWGGVAQIAFFFAALIALAVVMLSDRIRARLRLFVNKHFYHNKYDYREEWLRIINTLSDHESGARLRERVLKAIGQIVDSKGGLLFLKDDASAYASTMSWKIPKTFQTENVDSSMIQFLTRKDWIITIPELRASPEVYNGLILPDWIDDIRNAWLIIPLKLNDSLLGFILLVEPAVPQEINWEDRDLLKAAGQQAASYLALREASEKLERAHQFEAFNRLSAYVVHDLKNMVAQLSLVVSNAEKHKNNPEFMRDAIQTVDNAAQKMHRLLGQLKKGRFESEKAEIVQLTKVLEGVVVNRSGDKPIPKFINTSDDIAVVCEPERLHAVIEHLVQNAQDATAENGEISITLERDKNWALVRIRDTGTGMDEVFIRERLFRPFDTTKGNAGMGIGVYESQDFIKRQGGTLTVESEPGKGTCFTIKLGLENIQ